MNSLTPNQIRAMARQQELQGNTSGFARGYVQCNLVILPAKYAKDFLKFCQLNPKPCPIIAMAKHAGEPLITKAAIDVRTDFPKYRLYEHGVLTQEVHDISDYWRDDLVTFLLGCSFSFEEALQDAGIEIRNITEQKNVPMYRTNIACQSAGSFSGSMVVSMRPMTLENAKKAHDICQNYPSVHGAPVHIGDAAAIGITAINQPDFGDAVTIHANEVPVFWACGVTPQVAIEKAKPDFCITHSPGCMLVTDILNSSLMNNTRPLYEIEL
jgi:uncharacterized protein YcsI (UPF0317 family)